MPRVHFAPKEPTKPDRSVKFVSSGSTLLDLVLGGGWAQGRVSNVVGDSSSGKTLLAIEAMVNFARITRPELIHYEEAESAFDEDYAKLLGIPSGIGRSTDDERVRTIEDLERALIKYLDKLKGDAPSLYVLDSLDALSDEAEMERDVGAGSYGANKAKRISELFRKRVGDIADKNSHFFVISQVRENIGVTFGETKTRSGGKALRFYASQELWLSEIGKIKRTVSGVDRVVGVNVRARTKKNKVGPPFREADIAILFNYGVDDEESMLNWLTKYKALKDGADKEMRAAIQTARKNRDRAEVNALAESLRIMTREKWQAVEDALMPPLSKYGV